MSLINDMLKDLDSRNHGLAGAHAATLRGLGLAGMNVRRPLAGHAMTLGGAGLLIAVVLVGFAISNESRLQNAQGSPDARVETTGVRESPMQDVAGTRLEPAGIIVPAQSNSAPVEVPAVTGHSHTSQQRDTPAAGAAAKPFQSASEPAAATSSHIEVSPRPLSREQQLAHDFQAAATAVNDGNNAEAERLLEDLLMRDNGQHKARLLLAGLYIQQQRNSRAESLLASGLLHYPLHAPYAKLYAQLLAAQARDSEAIIALQGALPAAGKDAEYHALLAGLYQRNGKSGLAASGYREALRLAPAHGEWWMGLGISSEQAGDTNTATTAYRQALHYPMSTALQQYVEQRLKTLAH